MILTVEKSEKSQEVAICFDGEGLCLLIYELEKLSENKQDHTHLMTPSWAGCELTEELQTTGGHELVHHLLLVRVPDA